MNSLISLPNPDFAAATTFDICKTIGDTCRVTKTIRIVSLLQPSPETVALFDELILIEGGQVIYSGPVREAVHYFESLGYVVPDSMDPADWLLVCRLSFASRICTGVLPYSQLGYSQ